MKHILRFYIEIYAELFKLSLRGTKFNFFEIKNTLLTHKSTESTKILRSCCYFHLLSKFCVLFMLWVPSQNVYTFLSWKIPFYNLNIMFLKKVSTFSWLFEIYLKYQAAKFLKKVCIYIYFITKCRKMQWRTVSGLFSEHRNTNNTFSLENTMWLYRWSWIGKNVQSNK